MIQAVGAGVAEFTWKGDAFPERSHDSALIRLGWIDRESSPAVLAAVARNGVAAAEGVSEKSMRSLLATVELPSKQAESTLMSDADEDATLECA